MFATTSTIKDFFIRLRHSASAATRYPLSFSRFKHHQHLDLETFVKEYKPPKLKQVKGQYIHNGENYGAIAPDFRKSRLSRDSGRRLLEDSRSLPLKTDVLGESARIRIVRDQPKKSKFPSTPTSKSDLEALKQIVPENILQETNAEGGTIDVATVNLNIEQLQELLRPSNKPEKLPTARQCDDVTQLLLDGFTMPQLENYLAATNSTPATNDLDLTRNFVSEKYVRSPWISGVSVDFPGDALSRLGRVAKGWNQRATESISRKATERIETSRSLTKVERKRNREQSMKERLVEKILRHSWKIRTNEEEYIEGEVDIRINPDGLKLLLSHRSDIFQSLSQLYNAKVDVSRSHNIIRLTADFGTCHDLLKVFQFTLDNICQEELDLKTLEPDIPSQAYQHLRDGVLLEGLGKLTNTLVTPRTSEGHPTKLQVSYLGPDATDLEDVRRLISQLMKPDKKGESQISYLMTFNDRLYQAPADIGITLPWMERGRRSTRWSKVMNVKKDRPPHGAPNVKAFSDLVKHENDTMSSISQFLIRHNTNIPIQESQADSHWDSLERHSIVATIGQVVFPDTRKQSHAIQPRYKVYRQIGQSIRDFGKSFRLSMNSPHIFIPSPFNLMTVLHMNKSQNPRQTHELRIRLRPAAESYHMVKGSLSRTSKSYQTVKESCPDIDLFIDIDWDKKRTKLKDARLISDDRISDLMLPEEAVDVRLEAHSYLTFSKNNIDPNILSFIDSSNLDMWGTDRLRTPSRIQLSVPKYVIGPRSSSGQLADGGESVKVEYTFLSLEQRSSLHLEYESYPLIYTTIEAGRSGGRRDELCLHMPTTETTSKHVKGPKPLTLKPVGGPNLPNPSAVGFSAFYNTALDFSANIKVP